MQISKLVVVLALSTAVAPGWAQTAGPPAGDHKDHGGPRGERPAGKPGPEKMRQMMAERFKKADTDRAARRGAALHGAMARWRDGVMPHRRGEVAVTPV